MTGNVREWTWNTTDDGRDRLILGGAWNDPIYMSALLFALPPFDRSPENGFRGVTYLADPPLERLVGPVEPLTTDFRGVTPVSDEVLDSFRRQFPYERSSPLNARVEARDESSPYSVQERIVFDTAYGAEEVVA